MAANPERRAAVTDAALEVLGRHGARALTHRAVDAEAAVPPGTTSNYFPSRVALLTAMAERVFAQLAPDPDRLARLAQVPAANAGAEYAAYVTERLVARPTVARALLELRLEAGRSPEVGAPLMAMLREGLAADVEFQAARGLPGGRDGVAVLQHLVYGIVLDAVTAPLVPGADPVAATRHAAAALYAARRDPGTTSA